MISLILNLIAPMAVAEKELSIDVPYSEFVETLCRERKTKYRTDRVAKIRVDGDFFAAVESKGVAKGKAPNPTHYDKLGFYVIVEDIGDGSIILRAETRVILGWLETAAVGEAMAARLEQLVEETTGTGD